MYICCIYVKSIFSINWKLSMNMYFFCVILFSLEVFSFSFGIYVHLNKKCIKRTRIGLFAFSSVKPFYLWLEGKNCFSVKLDYIRFNKSVKSHILAKTVYVKLTTDISNEFFFISIANCIRL